MDARRSRPSHDCLATIAGYFGHRWRQGLQYEAKTLESIQTRSTESGTDYR